MTTNFSIYSEIFGLVNRNLNMSIRPFTAIRKAWNSHPAAAMFFQAGMQPKMLVAQITNHCTNRCKHCTNTSGPEDRRTMDVQTAQRVISEAAQLGITSVHIWGGEPFKHPDLMAIVKEVFAHNLGLVISSNGFWGVTKEAALEKLAAVLEIKPADLKFQLTLSCDDAHQSQPATPVEKIVNILRAAQDIDNEMFYLLLNVTLMKDEISRGTFIQALADGGFTVDVELEGQKWRLVYPGTASQISLAFSEVERAFGRAKDFGAEPFKGKPESNSLLRKKVGGELLSGELYVGVDGEVFIHPHFVGDKIFSIGDIYTASLPEIVTAANADVMIRMLSQGSLHHLICAYRKYVGLGDLLEQSYSTAELFRRLWEIPGPQHDETQVLQAARGLVNEPVSGEALSEALDAIRYYGDFTDAPALEAVFTKRELDMEHRWQAAIQSGLLYPGGTRILEFFEFEQQEQDALMRARQDNPAVSDMGERLINAEGLS